MLCSTSPRLDEDLVGIDTKLKLLNILAQHQLELLHRIAASISRYYQVKARCKIHAVLAGQVLSSERFENTCCTDGTATIT